MSVKTHRFNDFFYDPLYIVSGPKDHYKQAKLAAVNNAKITFCPIFENMFTDLAHLPKKQMLVRKTMTIPPYVDRVADAQQREPMFTDINGVDRHRFFQVPVKKHYLQVPSLNLQLESPRFPTPRSVITTARVPKTKVNRIVQTQYRESSAQTSPWEPDFKVIDGSDPEILKLDFLKWGSGLPVGMHEVILIERARMKRAWEKSFPPITDEKSLQKRRDVIEAIERDEWAFREQEIQDIQDIRYELLEKMLNELLENTKTRSEKKMNMFCKQKLEEKNEKLAKLRRDSKREKRRLDFHHRGIIMKYHPINIVDEHADYKSELYAPLKRHGSHPKRWHQVIDDHTKKYKPKYIGVNKYETLPKWLDIAIKLKDSAIKLPGTRLCQRETKWSKPVLKELHDELKCLRRITRTKCSLRVRVAMEVSPPPTPEVDDVDDEEETHQQGAILIQSVIRGRAAQILIFEGRDNCRELIEELRSTHAILDKRAIEVFKQKLNVKYDQREETLCIAKTSKIQEALNRLQGTVVGTLLDFLNKELRRLLDERKAHALGLMAERERHNREAAEAGRRQAEIRRRREHDEMFRQVVKIKQETVDLYLEDIIAEGMDFTSSSDAKNYIVKVAEKLDKEINENEEYHTTDVSKQEELVADLVHYFVLPEVQKEIIRERIKKKEKGHLRNVHSELFGEIESLPKPIFTEAELEELKQKQLMKKKKRPPKAPSAHTISSGESDFVITDLLMGDSREDVRSEVASVNKLKSVMTQETFISDVTSFLDFM